MERIFYGLISGIIFTIKLGILFYNKIEWSYTKRKFRSVGEKSRIPNPRIILGHKYIQIGDNFRSSFRFRMEALDLYQNQRFKPEIRIGNNVGFNLDIHIACINYIEIGDNVLGGSRIFISDHSHGNIDKETLLIPPRNRQLISKGPVIIKSNVWIGEGVVILPNVTIGENSIIGANTVVTKNVPPNCVVGGIPAKIIKQF